MYHATKYESAASEFVALFIQADPHAADGEVDSPTGYFEVGVVDMRAWLSTEPWFHGDSDVLALLALIVEHGVRPDDVDGWHVVVTNDQGFVGTQSFADQGQAMIEYNRLEAAYSEYLEDED